MVDDFLVPSNIQISGVPGTFQVGAISMIIIGPSSSTPYAIPDNWIECDGSQLLKTDFQELFSVIGTNYGETNGSGGVGTTHFRVPLLKNNSSKVVPAISPSGSNTKISYSYHNHTPNTTVTVDSANTSHTMTNSSQNINVTYTAHDHAGSGSAGYSGGNPNNNANKTGNARVNMAGAGHNHATNSYGYSYANGFNHNHSHNLRTVYAANQTHTHNSSSLLSNLYTPFGSLEPDPESIVVTFIMRVS